MEDEEEVALGAVLGRAEPSSLTLLSSERGEGRLSVSELLLAPPEKKEHHKRAGHEYQLIC